MPCENALWQRVEENPLPREFTLSEVLSNIEGCNRRAGFILSGPPGLGGNPNRLAVASTATCHCEEAEGRRGNLLNQLREAASLSVSLPK